MRGEGRYCVLDTKRQPALVCTKDGVRFNPVECLPLFAECSRLHMHRSIGGVSSIRSFWRLKSDLRRLGEAFAERTVERISIAGLPKDAPELDLWQKLADYGELRSRRVGKLHLCACERNSLKQFTKEAETARSPYNRSVIGARIQKRNDAGRAYPFAVF
jgi:hypothetical protein